LILNADNQIVDRPYARALNSFEACFICLWW
jgi:hypothetical protein